MWTQSGAHIQRRKNKKLCNTPLDLLYYKLHCYLKVLCNGENMMRGWFYDMSMKLIRIYTGYQIFHIYFLTHLQITQLAMPVTSIYKSSAPNTAKSYEHCQRGLKFSLSFRQAFRKTGLQSTGKKTSLCPKTLHGEDHSLSRESQG